MDKADQHLDTTDHAATAPDEPLTTVANPRRVRL